LKTLKVTILILPLRLWLLAGLCCASVRAQTTPVRSVTGQFSARKLERTTFLPAPADPMQTPVAGGWAYLLSSSASPALRNNDEVYLEPAMLVVSCEQVKNLLLARLEMADRWQGRIDLTINPSLAEGKGPQLRAEFSPRGWNYKLELPHRMQEEILMRWLIFGMLLEVANRQAGAQSADVPLWLVEGVSADLQANNFPTYIHQPGQNWTMDLRWNKRAEMMPTELSKNAPLSFQQLSWPRASDLRPEGLPLYRSCAQFFLEDLLRLEDGRACLRSMIGQLPQHWNWQTAFLQAFHSHFEQLLDVEKWWSVNCVNLVSEYKVQTWSDADCLKTLQSSLDVPVSVHFEADQLPVQAMITLQEVIRQWRPSEADEALQRAVGGLKFLAPRATPQWRPLVQLYLKTLLDYLHASRMAGQDRQLGRNSPQILPGAKADAIKQLNALDRQREAMRPSAVSTNLPQLSAAEPPNAKPPDSH
jgi:hypothetical protein